MSIDYCPRCREIVWRHPCNCKPFEVWHPDQDMTREDADTAYGHDVEAAVSNWVKMRDEYDCEFTEEATLMAADGDIEYEVRVSGWLEIVYSSRAKQLGL